MENDIEQEDMTPILLEDLGMRFPKANSNRKRRFGIYKCQYCDNSFQALLNAIKTKNTKSCGCLKGEKHEGCHERLYKIWGNIKNRCLNESTPHYADYGGRGITICDDWKNSYIAFRDWSLNNGYSDELSIDRIDVDGNYEPNNCRWVTKAIQSRNTRVIQSNNTSGFRGVCWNKNTNKWKAVITVNNKKIYLGCFETVVEGAIAYNNYVIENNLEHTLNIIPKDYFNNKQIKGEN